MNIGYLWRSSQEKNIGYVLLRVCVGIGMLTHGIPKIAAGPELWERLGGNLTGLGIPGPAVFWGFMAAFAESFGAVLLIIGLLTPAAAFLIFATMTVAVLVAHSGDPFSRREMALLYMFSSLMFMLKGAGQYSIDRFLPHGR